MPTLSACAPLDNLSGRTYQTVASAPQRDTKKAIQATARAEKLMERGRTEKARAALEEALIADVTYGAAHNNLGKYHYDNGEYYLASWEFEYAARLMPEIPEPHNNLGLVFEAVERLDQAIEYYTLAHEMDPQNPEFIGNLARARLKRDDADPEASRLLSDLVLYDTRPAWTRWARGRLGRYSLPGGTAAPTAAETLPAPQAAPLLPEALLPETPLPEAPLPEAPAIDSRDVLPSSVPAPSPVPAQGLVPAPDEQTTRPSSATQNLKGPLFGLPVPDLGAFLKKR